MRRGTASVAMHKTSYNKEHDLDGEIVCL